MKFFFTIALLAAATLGCIPNNDWHSYYEGCLYDTEENLGSEFVLKYGQLADQVKTLVYGHWEGDYPTWQGVSDTHFSIQINATADSDESSIKYGYFNEGVPTDETAEETFARCAGMEIPVAAQVDVSQDIYDSDMMQLLIIGTEIMDSPDLTTPQLPVGVPSYVRDLCEGTAENRKLSLLFRKDGALLISFLPESEEMNYIVAGNKTE